MPSTEGSDFTELVEAAIIDRLTDAGYIETLEAPDGGQDDVLHGAPVGDVLRIISGVLGREQRHAAVVAGVFGYAAGHAAALADPTEVEVYRLARRLYVVLAMKLARTLREAVTEWMDGPPEARRSWIAQFRAALSAFLDKRRGNGHE